MPEPVPMQYPQLVRHSSKVKATSDQENDLEYFTPLKYSQRHASMIQLRFDSRNFDEGLTNIFGSLQGNTTQKTSAARRPSTDLNQSPTPYLQLRHLLMLKHQNALG
jgi:hypothetical protein